MEIFCSNNTNIKYNVDLILESLKSKINSIVDNSYEKIYLQIKTQSDLFNWINEIINLIHEEIDNFKSDLKQLIIDLNQQEPIKSEEQNGQNTRLGSEKEKLILLNQNIQLNEDKSFQYNNQNQQLYDDESYLNNIQNKQSNKDNFNKKNNQNIGKNRQVTCIKLDHSNNQNINLNEQANQDKKLDFFTSKDIQEENKEITRIFQKEALNYIDDDEEIENKTIAKFLINVANISRRAYNKSNDLFVNMFKEFSNCSDEEKTISTLKNDEQLRKEFSSWVKEYEKKSEGKKKYENYFNSFKDKDIFDDNIIYLSTLFSQLTILYFHCELSFPIVDAYYNLNSKILFNHEKMIDFINKGNNRKVDFIILPSLVSNGNYLENGKFWVYTYNKDTFRFGKLRFENLVNKYKKYNGNYSKNNLQNNQNKFIKKIILIRKYVCYFYFDFFLITK